MKKKVIENNKRVTDKYKLPNHPSKNKTNDNNQDFLKIFDSAFKEKKELT